MGWLESVRVLFARLIGGPQSFTDQMPMDSGGSGLKSAWRSWLQMTYTGDAGDSGPGASVDLSDLNRRIRVIFRDYFEEGELGPPVLDDLANCETTLARIVPTLSGNARQYFAMASSIARGILDAGTEPVARGKLGGTDA
jgi:hypothetical protein